MKDQYQTWKEEMMSETISSERKIKTIDRHCGTWNKNISHRLIYLILNHKELALFVKDQKD